MGKLTNGKIRNVDTVRRRDGRGRGMSHKCCVLISIPYETTHSCTRPMKRTANSKGQPVKMKARESRGQSRRRQDRVLFTDASMRESKHKPDRLTLDCRWCHVAMRRIDNLTRTASLRDNSGLGKLYRLNVYWSKCEGCQSLSISSKEQRLIKGKFELLESYWAASRDESSQRVHKELETNKRKDSLPSMCGYTEASLNGNHHQQRHRRNDKNYLTCNAKIHISPESNEPTSPHDDSCTQEVDQQQPLTVVESSPTSADEPTDVNSGQVYCEALQNPTDIDEKDFEKKFEDDEALDGLHRPSREQDIEVNVVAVYSEDHNPALPLALQQQLATMNPREYLNHVINVLTVEQREALMGDEVHRRRTFMFNWPHRLSTNLSGIKMAQAGLYYLGNADRVQCAFCRGRLHEWEVNDEPMVEHARLFNFCRFVKGLTCGNVEYRASDFTRSDMQHITQFGTAANVASTERVDGYTLGISTVRAAMARYAPPDRRRATFARWPEHVSVTPDRLTEAGFYYTGFDDIVRCFFCAGGLRDWQDTDDPWEEHARWYPNCLFLSNVKGKDYINEVHERTPAHLKYTYVRTTQLQPATNPRRTQERRFDEMKSCCVELGHSALAVDLAIARNGGAFADVKDLIEALYEIDEDDVEEAQLEGEIEMSGPEQSLTPAAEASGTDVQRFVEQPVLQVDEVPAFNPQTTSGQPHENVSFSRTASSGSNKNNCKLCESTNGNIIPATHVCLPCGHLSFCDTCNADEARKCLNPEYSSKCPSCGAILSGSIKVWFA